MALIRNDKTIKYYNIDNNELNDAAIKTLLNGGVIVAAKIKNGLDETKASATVPQFVVDAFDVDWSGYKINNTPIKYTGELIEAIEAGTAASTTVVAEGAGITVTDTEDTTTHAHTFTISNNIVLAYNAAKANTADEGEESNATPATITLKSVPKSGEEAVEYGSIDVSDIIGNSLLSGSTYDISTGILTLKFNTAEEGVTSDIDVDLTGLLDINDVLIGTNSQDYLEVNLTGGENSQAVLDVKTVDIASTVGMVKNEDGIYVAGEVNPDQVNGLATAANVAEELVADELVIAAALNDLNSRLLEFEEGENSVELQIENAIDELDVTETEVGNEGNVIVTYNEENGIVTISDVTVMESEAEYTPAQAATETSEFVPANLSVPTNEEGYLLTTGAINNIKLYVDAHVAEEIENADKVITIDEDSTDYLSVSADDDHTLIVNTVNLEDYVGLSVDEDGNFVAAENSEVPEGLASAKDVAKELINDEEVIAAALNDLNSRLSEFEEGENSIETQIENAIDALDKTSTSVDNTKNVDVTYEQNDGIVTISEVTIKESEGEFVEAKAALGDTPASPADLIVPTNEEGYLLTTGALANIKLYVEARLDETEKVISIDENSTNYIEVSDEDHTVAIKTVKINEYVGLTINEDGEFESPDESTEIPEGLADAKDVAKELIKDELVLAAALNDINERMTIVEEWEDNEWEDIDE